MTHSHSSVARAVNSSSAEEIRRLVQLGKDRGLIRSSGDALPVEKNGSQITNLGTIRTQWMDVDPATAKRWLENNFRNRPLCDDVVQAYARDIMNGVWIPTHQGVAFNDKDELIDGQHRLHAIVLTGKTVRIMVTFGLPSNIPGKEMTTMDAVDRGRTRSVADQLTIQHGFKNASITASICSSLAGICYGERTRRLSVGQTLEIFRSFENAVTWLIQNRSKEHGLKTAGVLAGFAFAMATESVKKPEDVTSIRTMYLNLMNGDGLREQSAIKLLRAFLTSDDAKLLTRRTDRGLAELVLQAIHLEAEGRTITKLEMSTDGVQFFRFQQPDRVSKIAGLFQLPKLTPVQAAAERRRGAAEPVALAS